MEGGQISLFKRQFKMKSFIVLLVVHISQVGSCDLGSDVWQPWGPCSRSCGGGTRRRHGDSCFWGIDNEQTGDCNEFCYNGGNYYGKSCHCPSWRYGSCCEYCVTSYYIPNCIGSKECGESPDNIRCTQCASPYYPGGYGRGCLECTQISNCKIRHCSNTVDQVCDECVDDKVFYKRWDSDKTCERMCSFDAHTCWPGVCRNELTSSCQCASGFRKINDTSKTSCQLEANNKPSINTCKTRIDGKNGEAKQTTAGNCSRLTDFYGNFQPTSLRFDMQADFVVDLSTTPKPSATRPYIQEEHFGITDASVLTNKVTVSGQVSRLETVSLKTDLSTSTNATATFAYKMNYALSKSSSLQNGERLCVIFEAFGGGYVKTKDFRTNSVQSPVPYDKTTRQETICYRYDDEKPIHCRLEITCTVSVTEPLQVANRITRSSEIPVSFYGWKDPIPVGGTAEHASGIESFQVTVHEVFDGIVDLKKVFDKKMNASETSLTINLTSAGPRLYCLLLEVKDVADNVQQARRFVLYDNSTTITSRQDKSFIVKSASKVTGYKWQTQHNEICLDWKDYFYNSFYSNNNLLGKINPEPNGLIKGIYEQETGLIPVSGTPNVDGITAFRFSWSLNNGAPSSKENVPNFLNQSYCKRLNLADGEIYTLIIEAVDIVNNTYSENRTVHIDRTVPHINNIGLVKNGVKQLFVHDRTDFLDMNLNFEAFDPHSGILTIEWIFGISDLGLELSSGVIVATEFSQTTCQTSASACYCPNVGKCEIYNYSIPLSSFASSYKGFWNHTLNYVVTLKATNNAMLSRTESLDIFIVDSSPLLGPVQKGINCTFDNGTLCGWTQLQNDEFDWTLVSGPALDMGPRSDHTTENDEGKYLDIESASRKFGEYAIVASPILPSMQTMCFEFWNFMYGDGVGNLFVYIQDIQFYNITEIYKKSGNHGNRWNKDSVTINGATVPNNYRLLIKAEIGTNLRCDISIDDLSTTNGQCKGILELPLIG